MNMTDESRRHGKVVFLPPTAFQGVLIIAFGVVLLLSQLGVLPPFKVAQLWPSLLIVAGLAIAFRSALADDRIVGGFLAAVGVLFQYDEWRYDHVFWSGIWPLLLILMGAFLIWGTIANRKIEILESPDMQFYQWSFFSGVKRRIVTKDFRGGKVVSLYGGCELDLTEAEIVGDSAVLDVRAIFGGCEIRVPKTWKVSWKGNALGMFAGLGDRTRPTAPGSAPALKNLIVKGRVIFGALVIRN
jgi:predicted membrane protein